jgi:methyltransferase-like protein
MSNPPPSTYDEVIYPAGLYPQTHPDRLASTAIVLGMSPTPVSSCRVLELGCGDGLNLIAMAFSLPESHFVGIDLAARPLAKGRELAELLGLKNIALQQLDIAEASSALGRFDYIIAHGVYSWVPAEVRDQLLALCGRLLTEQGVAYVSYNAQPGNHLRDLARQMMLYHVARCSDPTERISQARALLHFLAESSTESDAYHLVLKKEVERVVKYSDAAFYHDDLSPINHAVYFHEFIDHASRHGLQYLAEAQTMDLPDDTCPAQVKEKLAALKHNNLIAGEQYTDFVRCRAFRQTLLCRKQVQLDRELKPERLRGLYAGSPARSSSTNPDINSSESVDFSGPNGLVFTTNHPLAKAAFIQLRSAWPRHVSFDELLRQVRAQLGRGSGADEPTLEDDAKALEGLLGRGHATSFVELHTRASGFVTEVTERPMTSALARLQLRQGNTVATLQHILLRVEEPLGQHLIHLLDGTRDRTALLRDLSEAVRSGTVPVLHDGQPVAEVEDAVRILDDELDKSLAGLARCALLTS